MSLRISLANCMPTINVMKQGWKQTKMRMKTIKEIKVQVLKRRKKFLSSRQKSCRLPLTDSKKEKQETATESEPKTSKLDEEAKELMRQIFNEVLKRRDCTPEAWRRIRIKVIYKKGDVEEAGNYRPTCTPTSAQTLHQA